MRQIKRILAIPIILIMLFTQVANAASIFVDATSDGGSADANCDLRDAILSSNSDIAFDTCTAGSGNDSIIIVPAGTITLSTGEILITDGVEVQGAALDVNNEPTTIIDGAGVSRLFLINSVDLETENFAFGGLDLTNGSDADGGLVKINNNISGFTKTSFFYLGTNLNNGDATGNGGALYVGENNNVQLTNAEMQNNAAGGDGGAVYFQGSATNSSLLTYIIDVNNTDYTKNPIANNSAINNGGAFYLGQGANMFTHNNGTPGGFVNITGNTAGTDGGAFYFDENNSGATSLLGVADTSVKLSGNSAINNGGAITVKGRAVELNSVTVGDTNTVLGNGGGIQVEDGVAKSGDLTLINTGVISNQSGSDGAGINFEGTGNLTLHGSGVTNNSITGVGNGAGISFKSAGTVELNPGSSVVSNTGAANGGGIYVSAAADHLQLSGTDNLIQTNLALQKGGGVYSETNVNIDDFDFDTNQVTSFGSQGGGLYLTGDSITTITGDTFFLGNTAQQDGGAVFIDNGSMNITNAFGFENNEAVSGYGGGIYVDSDPLVTYVTNTGTPMVSNTAIAGGAIYQAPNTNLTIIDTSIYSNEGMGAAVYSAGDIGQPSDLTITGTHLDGHDIGGSAVVLQGDTHLVLDGRVSTNLSEMRGFEFNDQGGLKLINDGLTGVPQADISYSIFNYNKTIEGAGISNNGGIVNINNTSFFQNEATERGGAIASRDGTLNLLAGTRFFENTAIEGGAVKIVANGAFLPQDSVALLDDVIFENNYTTTSSGRGGGLSAEGAAPQFLDLTIQNSRFTNNQSDVGAGAQIGLENGNVLLSANTFANNAADSAAGGLTLKVDHGSAEVSGNTFNANTSGQFIGGAFFETIDAPFDVINNTFYSNSTLVIGGGLGVGSGVITLINNTINSNIAGTGGGGIGTGAGVLGVEIRLVNNIIAENYAPSGPDVCIGDVVSAITSLGHNQFFDITQGTCAQAFVPDSSDIFSSGPLENFDFYYGGTTKTRPPLSVAPVVNAADPLFLPSIDQNGNSRPQPLVSNGDIGSVEIDEAAFDPAPIISETVPVPTPTTDTTPSYSFTSNEAGTLFSAVIIPPNPPDLPGVCVPSSPVVVVGSNTITFNLMALGTYADCYLAVQDSGLNFSNILHITPFTIVAPTEPAPEPAPAGGGSAFFGQPACSGDACTGVEPEPLPLEPLPDEPLPLEPLPVEPTPEPAPEPAPTPTPVPAPIIRPAAPTQEPTPQTGELPTELPTETVVTPTFTGGSSAVSYAFIPVAPVTLPVKLAGSCNDAYFQTTYGFAPNTSSDHDGDGLSDQLECISNTSPLNADSDNDGTSDSTEVLIFNSDPLAKQAPRGGIAITTPGSGQKSSDDAPLLTGHGPANDLVKIYLFDAGDFNEISERLLQGIVEDENLATQSEEQKQEIFQTRFTKEVQNILQKYLNDTLNPENSEESQFINHILRIGQTQVDAGGSFLLKPTISLQDNTYLAVASDGTQYSKEVGFTVDQSLNVGTPDLKSLGDKLIPIEALVSNLKVIVTPGNLTPVLVGVDREPVKIVANWKSNLVASALIADTANEEFRLSSGTPLSPGEHEVYVTAYRLSDNAMSKTIALKFQITKFNWYIVIWAAAALLLIGAGFFLFKRRRLATVSLSTEPEPEAPSESQDQNPPQSPTL